MDRLTYTVTESAALLGISRTSAYECVRRGEIPSLTLGRRVVISRVAVDRMLGGGTPAEHAPRRGTAMNNRRPPHRVEHRTPINHTARADPPRVRVM